MPAPTQAEALSEINPDFGQNYMKLHLLLSRSQKQCKHGNNNDWITHPQAGLFARRFIALASRIIFQSKPVLNLYLWRANKVTDKHHETSGWFRTQPDIVQHWLGSIRRAWLQLQRVGVQAHSDFYGVVSEAIQPHSLLSPPYAGINKVKCVSRM